MVVTMAKYCSFKNITFPGLNCIQTYNFLVHEGGTICEFNECLILCPRKYITLYTMTEQDACIVLKGMIVGFFAFKQKIFRYSLTDRAMKGKTSQFIVPSYFHLASYFSSGKLFFIWQVVFHLASYLSSGFW